MALGPREISDFLEISDFTARQRTPMPRLLHQIANVKFQALDPVEMPGRVCTNLARPWTWQDGQNICHSALCLAATCQDVQKTSQLHEPVAIENSEKQTSKLPHSRVQR